MLGVLLLLIPVLAQAGLSQIKIFDEEQDGTYRFYASNQNPNEYTVFFNYSNIRGFHKPYELPSHVLVPAGAKKQFLFELVSKEGARNNKFNYTISALPGSVENSSHNSDHVYLLPFPNNTSQMMGQGYNGKRTHKGMNALDFNMNIGNTVCAARGGTVVVVKEDSELGGPKKAYMFDANYVTIQHDDGSFSEYAHLDYNGVLVDVGDRVAAGQAIAKSGNSGYSSGPHLHFEVYILTPKGKVTLTTRFWIAGSKEPQGNLKERVVYTAWHPEADS